MCIAIVTTEHPQYPFILLNNRDEYLHRPTADATWWDPPNSHVLGGFDLHREVHGTWLGVTRQGRIAVLTNYREEGEAIIQGVHSRGGIVNAFLMTDPHSSETTEDFAQRLVDEDAVRGVGGFSLLFGQIRDVIKDGKKGLAIISNRTPDMESLIWVARGPHETHALSNSYYGDMSWPKVIQGQKAVKAAIDESVAKGESKEDLEERFFQLLSVDTLPRQRNGEEWEIYLRQLRHSIFIPAIGGNELAGVPSDEVAAAAGNKAIDATSGVYGTQKQSIILVDWEGKLTFVERTLFDANGAPIKIGTADRTFEFQIEGW
ncbi:DUF833-domain-containing protein [Lepidopterella palustris CBS 459.81]|uniref:DUF833-domain-containing protein n=1 Tax=Lepidopterella palustris CBS 459.81 TaxID=1314670 RepID=A0A8E2EGF4_9PEZI|nr:DUF833-domain-containing protein [Lepidopterella palustris CBS 459.81]